MPEHRSLRWAAVAALVAAAPGIAASAVAQDSAATAAAPATTPAPAPPPGLCGTAAHCAETNDFAAMITSFRTSETRGYKIIDVVVRFRNKTANPLILAYVQGSGTAVDEKGNRYAVSGANGVRGMGQVYGGTFDPKFTVPAGGVGDAQYELAWYPGNQIYGFTFQLDLTVDEINSYQGNQHTLGGEFPLHYEGLANGAGGGATLAAGAPIIGGGAAGGAPCNQSGVAGVASNIAAGTGSAAAQGATGKASTAVATATSTVSSIKSIFGHKKSRQPASDPCGQAAAGGAAAAPSSAGGTATAAQPAAAGKEAAASAPAPVTTTSTGAVSPTTGTAAAAGTAAKPAIAPQGARGATPAPATPPRVTTPAPTTAKPAAGTGIKPALTTPAKKPAGKQPTGKKAADTTHKSSDKQ